MCHGNERREGKKERKTTRGQIVLKVIRIAGVSAQEVGDMVIYEDLGLRVFGSVMRKSKRRYYEFITILLFKKTICRHSPPIILKAYYDLIR